MKLSNLAIPKDAQTYKPPKQKTEFERKRAAAVTYEQLVDLGYEEGMDFPEAWAEHVIAQRERFRR